MSRTFRIVPPAWRLPLLVLGLTLALLVVMLADTIFSMMTQWQSATTFYHCFFVLPITLALIWGKRRQLAGLAPGEERLALLPLATFALVWLIGRVGHVELVEHVALVGMAICIVIAMLGREFAKLAAFPLGFLLFMVPFGDGIIPNLQIAAADLAVWLFRSIGLSAVHDGSIMETPAGRLEIAKAFAGSHFLIANIMIGALFSYLAFGRIWKGALFMTFGAVLLTVAQSVAVFGIVLIAHLTNASLPSGIEHVVYSGGLVAVLMLAIFAIGTAIADWPASDDDHLDQSRGGVNAFGWQSAMAVLMAALIAAPSLYASNILNRKSVDIEIRPELMLEPTLALDLGPKCEALHEPSTGWRPSFQHADMIQRLKVDCGSKPVDLLVAYYAHERDGASLVQTGNRLADGERWTRIAASWHKPAIDGLPEVLMQEELNGREAGDRLVLAWYWVGGRAISKDWQARAYGLYRKLIGKDEPAALVALSAAYKDRPDEALPDIETVLAQHQQIDAYLHALAQNTD